MQANMEDYKANKFSPINFIQGRSSKRVARGEQPFLHAAHHLGLTYMYSKYHNISKVI